MLRRTTSPALMLLLSSIAAAHHSDAGLDLDATVTIEGTVTAFNWRNPHIYFTLETMDEQGNVVEWSVQMTSVAGLTRQGWDSTTLSPGDRVVVDTYPALNGRPYGKFRSIRRADGSAVVASAGTSTDPIGSAGASATSLGGVWVSTQATIEQFPGRMDGLLRRQATLTERGRAMLVGYVESSIDNPQLRCLTRPAPSMILYSDLYPLEIEFDDVAQTVTMRSGYFDFVRTAYLDGRDHPPARQRFYQGHAVGNWEGNTLVIDSRNFADYRSLQSGIPFGAQKHLVERYTLDDDGRSMTAEFTLEDPEFLSAAVTQRRQLVYAPDAETPAFDCDPSSTTGFLGQQMEED